MRIITIGIQRLRNGILKNTGITLYEKEIERIRSTCFSNEKQLETVIATKHFIDTNLEKALNLDLLSHKQFTSKYHLLRLFKRYYGLTPKQYLIDKRIEKAKVYLNGGMSVTETCFAVGFESVGSFSTLFKAKTGKSPLTYQKEQFSRNKSQIKS